MFLYVFGVLNQVSVVGDQISNACEQPMGFVCLWVSLVDFWCLCESLVVFCGLWVYVYVF